MNESMAEIMSGLGLVCMNQIQRKGGSCHGCNLEYFCEAFNGGTKLLSQAVKEAINKMEETNND